MASAPLPGRTKLAPTGSSLPSRSASRVGREAGSGAYSRRRTCGEAISDEGTPPTSASRQQTRQKLLDATKQAAEAVDAAQQARGEEAKLRAAAATPSTEETRRSLLPYGVALVVLVAAVWLATRP